MNTRNTGQWWKAWVLLTGLGATVLGWMAFPPDQPPPVNGTGSSQVSMSVEDAPQKPVFRAPVTRTRRS